MPKVMLVEDDNNLREIYDARLVAEGYEIVSAHDGEEALALAVKEKPDLIISDIMMPKISGFDMLDILRSTPETKNTKVIMMTALSQAEDRERAGKLGADRYLVKSQVTLEDVIKVAHEVLNDTGETTTAAAPAAAGPVAPPPTQADLPVVSAPAPAPVAAPAPAPAADATSSTPTTPPPAEPVAEETSGVEQQIQDFISNNPSITTTPTTPPPADDTASSTPTDTDTATSSGTSIPVTVAPTTPPIEPPKANDTPIPGEMPPAPKPPSGQEELSNPSPAPVNVGSAADAPSHKKLVLQPTEEATAPAVDLDALLAKEEASASEGPAVPTSGVVTPASTEDDKPTTVSPNDIAL